MRFYFILFCFFGRTRIGACILDCRAKLPVQAPAPPLPSVLWLQTDSHWTPGPRQSPQTPRAPRPLLPPFLGLWQPPGSLHPQFPGSPATLRPAWKYPPFPFPLWKTSPQTAPWALPAGCCIAGPPQRGRGTAHSRQARQAGPQRLRRSRSPTAKVKTPVPTAGLPLLTFWVQNGGPGSPLAALGGATDSRLVSAEWRPSASTAP